MTTPQNPGDGDTPQDPSDPQNPYGTPPPPPPSSPTPPSAPPPSTPIPPAPPANPMPPPYGDPNATTAMPPVSPPVTPPYGQPAPPAQPAYAQPSYPQYGTTPAAGQPGKGMAIGALIASILGCTCIGVVVAVPLAIIVLVRSRGGQNYGKGLAIAALVISALSVIVVGVGGYFVYDYAKDFKTVDQLKVGDCVTAKGLSNESADGVSEIRAVGCSTKHDGEVVATKTLTSDDASTYTSSTPEDLCAQPMTDAGKGDLLLDTSVKVTALTKKTSPSSGDKMVCVMYKVDGSKLTSKLGS